MKVSVSKLPLAASGAKCYLMNSSALRWPGEPLKRFGGDLQELLGEGVDGLAAEVAGSWRLFAPGICCAEKKHKQRQEQPQSPSTG